MDYDNDQEWQSYYDSMMIANSPGNLPYYPERYESSPSSSPPPYGRFGERVDDEGGGGGGGGGGIADDRIFYEGDAIIGRDVSYEDEERDGEEEEEEEEEAAGGGADDDDHPTTTTSPSDDDDHRGGSTGADMMMMKKKKKKRKGDGSRRKKRKSRRDPNKPKGCLTAVLLYSNANRARVKVENPDLNFGDIARLLSAEYSSLPPEGAATWQKASTDDRVRYNREMESYVPPPDDASDDDVSTTAVVVVAAKHDNGAVDADESRPASKRSKKDPNAPKKPLSSWHFFSRCSTARREVLAEHPGSTSRDVMVLLSSRYKALSEEERAALDERATVDRGRYDMEMMAYKAIGGCIDG